MSETEYSLGRNCGVTFAGIKPASMVCIKKHGLRDFERIARCFKNRGFSFCALKDNGERLLVLVYNDKSLYNVLFDKENKGFLEMVDNRLLVTDVGKEYVEKANKRTSQGGSANWIIPQGQYYKKPVHRYAVLFEKKSS